MLFPDVVATLIRTMHMRSKAASRVRTRVVGKLEHAAIAPLDTASTLRNASESSRTFAQSGLCNAKNRRRGAIGKTMRSLAGTHRPRMPSASSLVAADTPHAVDAANKTAVKKMFCFAREDQAPCRARERAKQARNDLRFAGVDMEQCRAIFFRRGC